MHTTQTAQLWRFSGARLLYFLLITSISCSGRHSTPAAITPPAKPEAALFPGYRATQIDGEIRGIWQDAKNNMWFASNGNGVFTYDGQTITNYTEAQGLPSNYCWMVEEDPAGNIWFKAFLKSNGKLLACRFDGQSFVTVQPDPGAVDSYMPQRTLMLDYCFDGQRLSEIQLPHTSPVENEYKNEHYYDIFTTCTDRLGNIWLGTGAAGLCKFDGKSYSWYAAPDLCPPIRDIFEDSKGTLWVGNNGGGLFRFDGKDFINFSKEKKLHNPDWETNLSGKPWMMARIWKIAEDKKGNLWIATIDNGLWKYDGKTVRHYTTKDGLGIDSIWTIYCDTNDRLWVGTAGDGVFYLKGDKFIRFKTN